LMVVARNARAIINHRQEGFENVISIGLVNNRA